MITRILDSKKLLSYTISTTDGELGKIKDIYFDEVSTHIRYLVIDTEKFLFRNLVLVSPLSIKDIDQEEEIIFLNLNKEKLEKSPSFDSVDTVSRLYEKSYNEYFAWPNYWESMHGPWVIGPFGVAWDNYDRPLSKDGHSQNLEELERCHLQSLNEVRTYSIHGVDGNFGHIQSLLFNFKSFKIEYWVLDTVNFFPSKLVLFPVEKVKEYNWREKVIEVVFSKQEIKSAPAYHVGNHGVASVEELKESDRYYGT